MTDESTGYPGCMGSRGVQTAERIEVACPCGTTMQVRRKRYEAGRGRYCSKECRCKYMIRPSGLTYVKHKDNPTWIKPGQHLSPTTQFQPGQASPKKGVPSGVIPSNAFRPGEEPWNKGTTGVMPAGADHHRWAGDDVGYGGLHLRLRSRRGYASVYPCAQADATCRGPMDWANISGEYLGTDDFWPLCRSHHIRYDRARVRPG